MKKNNRILILTFFIISTLISGELSLAQTESLHVPKDIEEAKELGEEALEVGKRDLPSIIKRIWQEEVLPIWKRMYEWFKINIWFPIFKGEVEPRLKEEIERRGPIIERELQVEKEEAIKDIPGLWKKLKELWQTD